jgi:hypothetical protein
MPLNFAMSLMTAAEFLLWATLGYVFWAKNLQRRFPAMAAYLALRVISMPLLLAVLWVCAQPWGRGYYVVYFFGFWGVYIASAIMLFFICMEIFRAVLSGFSGLIRFSSVIFRWAAVASLIVSLSNISFSHRGILVMSDMAYGLMRSVSVLELCLLAFLCFAMNSLRLTVRDLAFGWALGFGIMSSNDFIYASLAARNTSLTAPLQFVYESIMLLAVGVWVAYVALPEPARKPLVVSANSAIYRWNEIASALGHKGTNIAVPAPANSFFLTDVEKVVDKVLTRNLRESETGT